MTRTSITHTPFGNERFVSTYDEASGTSVLRRDVEYVRDGDFENNEIGQVRRTVGSGYAASVETTVRDERGRISTVTEPDGDVLTYSYSGATTEPLSIRHNGNLTNTWVRDDFDKLTQLKMGDRIVGQYSYGEDGRLVKEQLDAVPTTNGFFTKEYLETQVFVSGNLSRSHRKKTMNGTSIIHHVGQTEDHAGRPTVLFDHVANVPITEWFYDRKPTGYFSATPIAVEGTGRTILLTEATNQLNRPSMVRHRAGTTLYEYDALGRVTTQVQAEGVSLPMQTCTTSSQCSGSPCTAGMCTAPYLHPTNMKVFEVTYHSFGPMATLRYPSGRRVDFLYGSDRRAPTEVYMRVDPNGIGYIQRMVSNVKVDVDGSPISWTWGTVAGREHIISRDLIGRVLEIVDKSETTGPRATLQYLNYDADGNVGSIADQGPHPPIVRLGTAPATTYFGYGSVGDMLQSWTSPFQTVPTPQSLFIGPQSTGYLRQTESMSGTHVYTFLAGVPGESLNNRDAAGAGPLDIDLNWFDSRSVSSIDWGNDGTREITGFVRGPRGDYESYTVANGTHTQRRDHTMKRWSLTEPGRVTSFAYAPDGSLAELHNKSNFFGSTAFERDEYVYLQGIPIGVTHTESAFPSPASWWLSPDAMGTPRRVLYRGTGLNQLVWLVMDPWGLGQELNTGTTTYGIPRLPFRLPGQIADPTGLVENGYRTYLPDLGLYLQPDPMHQESATNGTGAQAFAYANGNPLKYIDPDGRLIELFRGTSVTYGDVASRPYQVEPGETGDGYTTTKWRVGRSEEKNCSDCRLEFVVDWGNSVWLSRDASNRHRTFAHEMCHVNYDNEALRARLSILLSAEGDYACGGECEKKAKEATAAFRRAMEVAAAGAGAWCDLTPHGNPW